ncbi:Panacea domain-containing protein [Exiguobacterium sp. s131]|uniref:Panacea domain-containing protein n=1 Tax=Exiguobacterium sp. s131 TaxID=2751278 RepID=UPI001BEAA5B0|nr:Panacea domain-containing protein [Exiguobacterium sp. s131]
MLKIKQILRYFVENYPYKNELSKTRITKMVFLADWYSCLSTGKQLTSINWYFDHYGPYVSDVFEAAKKDRRLQVKQEINSFGTLKEVVSLKDDIFFYYDHRKIEGITKSILDQVIDDTKNMNWTEFINYIYSSYPIKSSKKYLYLDLEALSVECSKKGIKY